MSPSFSRRAVGCSPIFIAMSAFNATKFKKLEFSKVPSNVPQNLGVIHKQGNVKTHLEAF